MKDDEITSLDATDLAYAIRTKRVTSRQALEAFIRRNKRLGPYLNCVVVFDYAYARKLADELDAKLRKGEIVGPLHGVPMTVKENNDVEGLVTTVGFPEYIGRVANSDEEMISRIKSAGTLFIPTHHLITISHHNIPYRCSNMGENESSSGRYGYPIVQQNIWHDFESVGFGTNTWRIIWRWSCSRRCFYQPNRVGWRCWRFHSHSRFFLRCIWTQTDFWIDSQDWTTLGTQRERNFRYVAHSDSNTHSHSHIRTVRGPLSKSPRDLAMILDIFAASLHLPRPSKTSLSEYRVAVWADDDACRVDDDVRETATNLAWTLRSRGVHVSFTARPDFDLTHNVETYKRLTAANSALSGETNGVTLEEYRVAQEAQGRIRKSWERFFRSYDVLIVPSHCTPAFKKDESPKAGRTLEMVVDGKNVTMPYWRALFWAILTNVGLLPSTTFPCGLGKRTNLPIGLNVVGPEWSDFITIDFARLLAEECGCVFRSPPPLAVNHSSGGSGKGGGGDRSIMNSKL